MTPKLLKTLLADRTGATAVEYGLLLTLISVGLIGGLSTFGGALKDMLDMIAGKIEP
jgi:pilus assembly protein Flp/PilA